MAVTSMVFGYILMVLGVVLYAAAVYRHLFGTLVEEAAASGNPWLRPLTALIPAAFGLALVLLGAVAGRSSSERTRMHVMHFAALIGLLGLVLPLVRIAMRWRTMEPLPLAGMSALALLSGAFLALCVQSFIESRRARRAREQQSPPPL